MATSAPNFPDGIEIFRAGQHTDTQGVARAYTAADIQAMASAYDPALHQAPQTVGHPEHDKPAYGWVSRLDATPDGRLLMRSSQVDAQFAEMVTAGRFKKRSASWYTPENPANPKPGTWYLRHVAWLGAEPPAIKGLKDPQFAEGDAAAAAVTFSESLEQPPQEKTMDKTAEELQRQLDAANATAAAEKARADQAEATVRASAEQRLQERRAANVAFAESQVEAGNLLPAAKGILVTTLEALADAQPVEYSEGGETKKKTPADWLKSIVSGGHPVVQFGEHAAASGALPQGQLRKDASDAEIDKAAQAHMRKHKCTYSEALAAVVTTD